MSAGGRRRARHRQGACAGLLDRDHRHAPADGRDPRGDAEAREEAFRRGRRTMRRKGILTTDHVAKEAVVNGSTFTLGGMAKGCGMIAPNMATMLAYLTTDAELPRDDLQRILKDAADRTFNTLNVDGATSTNDTVILLANGRRGQAGPRRVRRRGPRLLRGSDLADGEGRGGHDQDGHAERHRRRAATPRPAPRPRTSPRTISSNAPGTAATPIGAGCSAPRARRGSPSIRRIAGRLWRHHGLARRHRDRP